MRSELALGPYLLMPKDPSQNIDQSQLDQSKLVQNQPQAKQGDELSGLAQSELVVDRNKRELELPDRSGTRREVRDS